eukprot:TRINITY_DN7680_c0_g1_i1.p3 TRINITY_DN7680_c0_g1~~TRINITY_DN7680_c0_g1_i1.p3  ORF type:complete len:134 (+),score=30.78 TRINITY_DN7680_c0_g1_i1:93-494(+)
MVKTCDTGCSPMADAVAAAPVPQVPRCADWDGMGPPSQEDTGFPPELAASSAFQDWANGKPVTDPGEAAWLHQQLVDYHHQVVCQHHQLMWHHHRMLQMAAQAADDELPARRCPPTAAPPAQIQRSPRRKNTK